MRERYLESFTEIWIDNLHGDRIISEYTPDRETSETVFALQGKSPGIKVGTAIGVLVAKRAQSSKSQATLRYRDMNEARAVDRRNALLDSLEERDFDTQYNLLEPVLEIGLPFKPREMSATYLSWALLVELFPISYPGVTTARDSFLVDYDLAALEERVHKYFNVTTSHSDIRAMAPVVMKDTGRFKAEKTRIFLTNRGITSGQFVRYQYRPFDVRWLYWDPDTKLLDEKRAEYFPHIKPNNLWLTTNQRNRKMDFYVPLSTSLLADYHIFESNASMIPLLLYPEVQRKIHEDGTDLPSHNLTLSASEYLERVGSSAPELFRHVLAIVHAGRYTEENGGALRQDWPRIPLPATKDALLKSSELGERIAALLNTEAEVTSVTSGSIRPELRTIGNVTAAEGGTLDPARDLLIDAGWGRMDADGRISAGQGKLIERDYTTAEREAIAQGATAVGLTPEQAFAQLGERTCDVYLNPRAYWQNIPVKVWDYYIGGYQVIKKWLSYREGKLLGRALTVEEARYVRDMARRIAALCLMQPQLDANYAAVKANTYSWPKS